MPIILVYGLPEDYKDKGKIAGLYESLSNAIVEEIGLRREEITLFFPLDRMTMGRGEEIIIFVKGFFDKPERTAEVKNRLARVIVERMRLFFQYARTIECFIETINPQEGFFSSVN